MKFVILDVDTGIDDALAIAYAVQSPELTIQGITTCYGNIPVEDATHNTLAILEYLDCDIPVIPGAHQPLKRKKEQYATHVHGDNGLGNVQVLQPTRAASKNHAADFIIENVRERPNEVTLIMVGPLTNLALALMKAPEIAEQIGKVVVMGGAVRVPGNVTAAAEANIYSDPEAADLVFRSGVPLTLVGLDVTMKTLLPKKQLDIWREKNTSFARALADMTEFYISAYESFYPGIAGCALHDPLAVGVVLQPHFVKQVPMHVQVQLDGSAVGQTVEYPDKEPNIEVCTEVEADKFLEHFLNRVI